MFSLVTQFNKKFTKYSISELIRLLFLEVHFHDKFFPCQHLPNDKLLLPFKQFFLPKTSDDVIPIDLPDISFIPTPDPISTHRDSPIPESMRTDSRSEFPNPQSDSENLNTRPQRTHKAPSYLKD